MFEQFFSCVKNLPVFSIDDTVIEGPGDGCGGLFASDRPPRPRAIEWSYARCTTAED
jgi:hypothetical protein